MPTTRLEASKYISGYEEETAGDDGGEVKVRGRWLPCTLYEALTERDQITRCKYCYGPVQALKESSLGARAHIEHLQRHPGCRFPVGTFSRVESKHPFALK